MRKRNAAAPRQDQPCGGSGGRAAPTQAPAPATTNYVTRSYLVLQTLSAITWRSPDTERGGCAWRAAVSGPAVHWGHTPSWLFALTCNHTRSGLRGDLPSDCPALVCTESAPSGREPDSDGSVHPRGKCPRRPGCTQPREQMSCGPQAGSQICSAPRSHTAPPWDTVQADPWLVASDPLLGPGGCQASGGTPPHGLWC